MNAAVSVAVIGASLAGASLALRLARQGIDVAVFDQSDFPRRKACGEGLSVLAVQKIAELGLSQDLAALEHADFSAYYFHNDSGKAFDIHFSRRKGNSLAGKGISRHLLDQLIISAATRNDSICFFPEEKIVKISRTSQGFEIYSSRRSIKARYLVLACGANSRLPDGLRFPQAESESKRFGLSCEVRAVASEELKPGMVNIFNKAGTQLILTPIAPDRFNMSMISSKSAPKSSIGWRKKNEDLLAKHAVQVELLSEPLGVSSIGRFRRASHSADVFAIGDCLEQFDPVGGMGMTHALVSAEVTANTIARLLHVPKNSARILNDHEDSLRRVKRPLRGFTRLSYLHMAQLGLTGLQYSHYFSPIAGKVVRAVSSLGQPGRNTSLLGTLLVNVSGVSLWTF